MALSLDRKAFIDILDEGQGDIGGRDAAAARRGMGPATRDAEGFFPGYDPDVEKNRTEARGIIGTVGLWARQPAPGQAVGPQHPDCPAIPAIIPDRTS